MGALLGTQNVAPPQWLLEVKENFVASRNRAQGELTPLHRKTTIITNIAIGIIIAGTALVVASIAAFVFAALLPTILIGSTTIALTIAYWSLGGATIGVAIAILGGFVKGKSENCYQREVEKQNEIYDYQVGLRLLDRIEQDKELQSAVEPYKESPERYTVKLYREKWDEKRRKKINELKSALSEAMGGTINLACTKFFFLSYREDQKRRIDQIQDADRKEKCRKLLIQLEEQVEDTVYW